MLVKSRRVDPAEDRGLAPVRVILVHVFRRRQIAVGQARQERIGLLRRPGSFLLLLHQLVEAIEVHLQAPLLGHELRQVDGEAIGVVKLEGVVAADGLGGGLRRTIGGGVEELQAAVEGPAETDLFGLNHRRDVLGPLPDFGEGIAEAIHDHRDQLVEEGLVQVELAAETRGPAENPAQDVAPALVGRRGAVGDREGQRTDMVRDDAEGIVGLIAELRGVLVARHLARGLDDRHEQVGVVVAVLVLEDGDDPLQAGARVDVPGGQRHEVARRLAVELDEDEVPQLDEPGAVAVDAALVARHAFLVAAVGPEVDMNLAARAARAGLAHLPEVLLLAEGQDATGRQGRQFRPQLRGLDILGQTVLLVAHEDRRPELFGVDAPDLRQQLPRPRDRLGLEVVVERPVAEHLEERVVVGVPADFFQVVMLAADAEALLAVDRPAPFGGLEAQEDVLELVHAGVGEQQGLVPLRHDRRARHERVLPGLEELNEPTTNLFGTQHSQNTSLLHRKHRDQGSGSRVQPSRPLTP